MKIDLVLVTKIEHLYTLNIGIKNLLNFYDINSIYIVTNKKYFKYFNSYPNKVINFIDEDYLLPNMTLEQLKSKNIPYFPKRAGWYFQQFLKLGIANLDSLSDNYIVVDADTIFLKKIPLIDSLNKFVFLKASEFHKPYFDNYKILLKEYPNREFSFISQYMVFNKTIVKSLFTKIESNFDNTNSWNWLIINNLQGESASLFSEYETYGHFIKNNYPDLCEFIDLPWLRNGSELLHSTFPKSSKIDSLKEKFYLVSFELKASTYYRKIKKYLFCIIFPYYQYCKKYVLSR